MTQVFVLDTIMYIMIALALKALSESRNDRKLCSVFNFLVAWPLGRHKMMELEIETSKLKEFD